MLKVYSDKMKKIFSASLGVAMVTGLTSVAYANPPELKWSAGAVPADAVVGGQFRGQPMNVCRMPMPNKELHSGKSWNGTCYVGFGGKELNLPLAKAEVLSLPGSSWVAGPAVPANAAQIGVSGGAPMYICRAKLPDGETHPGKLWKNNCYVGFGGKELKNAQFEVLTGGAAEVAAAPAAPAAPADAAAAPAAGPVELKECAQDGGRCQPSGDWIGTYGANGTFVNIFGSGPFVCHPNSFKIPDPVPRVKKTCSIKALSSATPEEMAEKLQKSEAALAALKAELDATAAQMKEAAKKRDRAKMAQLGPKMGPLNQKMAGASRDVAIMKQAKAKFDALAAQKK